VSKGVTWVDGRSTGTGWLMPVRIRIGRTRVGVGVCSGWTRTR
jgi:hypothetical protein